ncbi:hypothetical protein [Ciceribacter sp. L1K22]|uniref:hypothetical protein n=1 Tax=Ciceribacter sp. L1K22 TaxID=2820275 RepID=UPI001ABDBC73|nr:hypothetical protein [Ciceribacter sp. L1K22]MBO3761202.1 hypothetical protein [Ciceribacter sp. L1K22]
MHDTKILEIAICAVADKATAEHARLTAMESVRHYPGFISWRATSAHGNEDMVADIVEWENIDAARAAAEKVQTDPAFIPYMKQITTVAVMQHFDTKNIV